jgi:transposase-like protein/IS1 family transposase
VKSLECPNPNCSLCGKANEGNIHRHGFYRVKAGKRRRYRCSCCGATFCRTRGTAYHRLQHRRSTFDEVARLSVEGLNKSAIARVKRLAWNTVARWLERAATCCRRYNELKVKRIEITELQADELRTIVGGREQDTWIFTSLDVWSRLWPATVVGRRSYRNTRTLLRATARRMECDNVHLIVTDGFEFYERVVREIFGRACLHAQVIKTRRNDRVVKVERKQVIGPAWKFERALSDSEDSSTLNTSFIERLNLTIRQGSSFLSRRTKFGTTVRTPAMQAGLTSRPVTFREVFSSGGVLLSRDHVDCLFVDSVMPLFHAA